MSRASTATSASRNARDDIQIIHVAHQRRIALALKTGKFGAGSSRQRHEFLRGRLHDRGAAQSQLPAGRQKLPRRRTHRPSIGGRRIGQTEVSIWISGRKAPCPLRSARKAADRACTGYRSSISDVGILGVEFESSFEKLRRDAFAQPAQRAWRRAFGDDFDVDVFRHALDHAVRAANAVPPWKTS